MSIFQTATVGVLTLVLLTFTGCGEQVQATPTPDIDATVEAMLQERNEATDEIEEYYDAIDPALKPPLEAGESWTSRIEEHTLIDISTLTREDSRRMAQELLELATSAYVKANSAIHLMMAITPPEKCVDMHVATVESLQLMARGFRELKGYMELAIGSGRVPDERLELGNRLLAESYRVKQANIRAVIECSP